MINEYYSPNGENINEVLKSRELFQVCFNKKVSKNSFVPVFVVYGRESRTKFDRTIQNLKDNKVKITGTYYWKIPECIDRLSPAFISDYEKSAFAHSMNHYYGI